MPKSRRRRLPRLLLRLPVCRRPVRLRRQVLRLRRRARPRPVLRRQVLRRRLRRLVRRRPPAAATRRNKPARDAATCNDDSSLVSAILTRNTRTIDTTSASWPSTRSRGAMVLGPRHPNLKNVVHRHVLSDFTKDDRPWVEALLEAIADNAGLLATDRDSTFQNKVHLAMQAKGFFDKDDDGAA